MLYGFSQVILQGALVTLELALSSVVLAVLIGLAGAGAKLSSNRPLALVFEGYTTLIRGVPDLVLMDMYMPRFTGVEATRVLRQVAGYQSVPIVYLSSESDIGMQVEALRLGGDQFLQHLQQFLDVVEMQAGAQLEGVGAAIGGARELGGEIGHEAALGVADGRRVVHVVAQDAGIGGAVDGQRHFVTEGDEAKRVGTRMDVAEKGSGNQGHEFGTGLPAADKDALVEYLKTL